MLFHSSMVIDYSITFPCIELVQFDDKALITEEQKDLLKTILLRVSKSNYITRAQDSKYNIPFNSESLLSLVINELINYILLLKNHGIYYNNHKLYTDLLTFLINCKKINIFDTNYLDSVSYYQTPKLIKAY